MARAWTLLRSLMLVSMVASLAFDLVGGGGHSAAPCHGAGAAHGSPHAAGHPGSAGSHGSLRHALPAYIPFRLFPDRRSRPGWPDYGPMHAGKAGLEVGGPSDTFRDMKIYDAAARVDNTNFAAKTMWVDMANSSDFKDTHGVVRGQQFYREASDLRFPDGSYDFLISSHALEHAANPLKCMFEWARVLKPGGTLLMLLPWGPGTFDRFRRVASFAHLLEDYERDVGEDDLTHLDEIVSSHDYQYGLGGGVKTKAEFIERSKENIKHRALHQHVFDLGTLVQMTEYVGLTVLNAELFQSINMLVYAAKPYPADGGPHFPPWDAQGGDQPAAGQHPAAPQAAAPAANPVAAVASHR